MNFNMHQSVDKIEYFLDFKLGGQVRNSKASLFPQKDFKFVNRKLTRKSLKFVDNILIG